MSLTFRRAYIKQPQFSNPTQARRFMLWRDTLEQELELVEFDLERAIASVRSGQPAIPVWLDAIHQQLVKRLKEWGDIEAQPPSGDRA